MDYVLDIIISEKDLLKTAIEEVKFYWNGIEYSHTPKRFISENLSFIGLYGDDIYKYRTSKGIENPVMLISKDIYDLRYTVSEKISTHALVQFIYKVCKLEKFRIYICGDDEKPDCFIQYTENCDIPEIIYDTFHSDKNIVIYK